MVKSGDLLFSLLTGRTRFQTGLAFWLGGAVVPSVRAGPMAGLVRGQRRRTWTYDTDQGWTALNLVASSLRYSHRLCADHRPMSR
jgi:hypothetical protein